MTTAEYVTFINVVSTMSCASAKSSASLAFLRVIRLVRVLKLTKHSVGLQVLIMTVRASSEELGLFLVILLVCMLVYSSIVQELGQLWLFFENSETSRIADIVVVVSVITPLVSVVPFCTEMQLSSQHHHDATRTSTRASSTTPNSASTARRSTASRTRSGGRSSP